MSAADPQPLLSIRSKYRAKAFRAIETVLREDPVLADVVKTWRSREGHDDDYQVPGFDMMPLVHLSPLPEPSETLGVDATKINFAVAVELYVPGTCVDDLFALWEAIEDAIVDARPFRGGTVRSFLCSCVSAEPPGPSGVARLRPHAPAFFAVDLRRPPEDRSSQRGVGTLTCFLGRPA